MFGTLLAISVLSKNIRLPLEFLLFKHLSCFHKILVKNKFSSDIYRVDRFRILIVFGTLLAISVPCKNIRLPLEFLLHKHLKCFHSILIKTKFCSDLYRVGWFGVAIRFGTLLAIPVPSKNIRLPLEFLLFKHLSCFHKILVKSKFFSEFYRVGRFRIPIEFGTLLAIHLPCKNIWLPLEFLLHKHLSSAHIILIRNKFCSDFYRVGWFGIAIMSETLLAIPVLSKSFRLPLELLILKHLSCFYKIFIKSIFWSNFHRVGRFGIPIVFGTLLAITVLCKNIRLPLEFLLHK
jgi:hypothetical protein